MSEEILVNKMAKQTTVFYYNFPAGHIPEEGFWKYKSFSKIFKDAQTEHYTVMCLLYK